MSDPSQQAPSLDDPTWRIRLVRSAFAFLERELDYRCLVADEDQVRFEDSRTFLRIEHGERAFSLTFGPLRAPGQAENTFSTADLAGMLRDPASLPWRDGPVSDLQQLAEVLHACSRFLYLRIPALLRGDRRVFDRLAVDRARRIREAGQQMARQLAERDQQQASVTAQVGSTSRLEGEAWELDDPQALAILAEAEQSARRRLEIFLRSTRREVWQRHTRTFRPQERDFTKVFVPQAAARAQSIYLALWQGELPQPAPWPGQTELRLAGCLSEWFTSANDHSRLFAAAYRQIAHLFLPGVVWTAWRYTRPDRHQGAAYDGLVRVGDRWIWLLRPHRLLAQV